MADADDLPGVLHLVGGRPGSGRQISIGLRFLRWPTARPLAGSRVGVVVTTAELMLDLHRLLRSGLAPAAALAAVQAAAADAEPHTQAAAASLICLRAGTAPSPLAV